MTKSATPEFKTALINYLIEEYFKGDVTQFQQVVKFPLGRIERWRKGEQVPQQRSIRWILSCVLTPEVRVLAEFAPVQIASVGAVASEIGRVLGQHGALGGIYGFYDSRCVLLYVGKASTNLKREMIQQLKGKHGLPIPRAVKPRPEFRWEMVTRVSAYEVPDVDHLDYPKHVEALVLRLAKPAGNRVLGTLTRKVPPETERKRTKRPNGASLRKAARQRPRRSERVLRLAA